jgi:hypothetical protein
VLPQHILAKDLGEEAARVAVPDRPYLLHIGDFGGDDFHALLYGRALRD